MTPYSLENDVAIVTGASSGIGRETALALAREGADVAVAARREGRLESVAEGIREAGSEALVVPTDVGDEDEVDALVESTVERFGRLDAVVANAGVMIGHEVESFETEDYRTMRRVNVDGAFFCARAALPHLRETDGHLLYLGSFAGQYPRPFNPVYAATKWWVEGFARSLAGQVGDDGVAVSTVRPTEVRTELGGEEGESLAERFEPGEMIEPEEVAETIVFAIAQPNASLAGIDVYRRDKFAGF